MRADITDTTDVVRLVDDFYHRVYADDLLRPIFVDVAGLDLEQHLPIMVDFWETVLLRSGAYRRNALQPHVDLHRRVTLERRHFDRWLALWHQTLDERHEGPVADLAKKQAVRIAASLSRRLAGGSASEHVTIGPRPEHLPGAA